MHRLRRRSADQVVGHLGGVDAYGDLRRSAQAFDLGDGLVVEVASLLDVIRSKQAANRDKDRAALPLLRRLLERFTEGRDAPGD